MPDEVPYGIYRHFRGKLYQVFGVARHTETGDRLVVYEPTDGTRGLWARPVSMFLATVKDDDGQVIPRFKRMPPPDVPASFPGGSDYRKRLKEDDGDESWLDMPFVESEGEEWKGDEPPTDPFMSL